MSDLTRRMTSRPGRVLAYVLTVAAILGAWKGLSLALGQGPAAVLPPPEACVAAFVRALGTGLYWEHTVASAGRATAAMVAAFAVGFPVGVAMGGSRKVDAALAPFVLITYPVPKIVLLPVAFLLFGLGDLSRVVMISLILGYQVLVTSRDAARGLSRAYLDSVRSLGATRWQLYTECLIPAALPGGFTALRLNSGVGVAVLFIVETFATQRGLGYLIIDAWGRLNYEAMFTGIFGLSLLGVALHEAVNLLERRVCAWRFCGRP